MFSRLFRLSSSANEWQWIMLDDLPGFMDEDVLELSMIVKDPCFLQQIENKGYDLGSLYKFNIENRVVEVNANYVWKKETNGQKLKDEFCRITLKPVETAPEKLRMLRYPEFTIRFSSPAYYWEYLCVFRDENDMRGKELNLKSRENIMAFCKSRQIIEHYPLPLVRGDCSKHYSPPFHQLFGLRRRLQTHKSVYRRIVVIVFDTYRGYSNISAHLFSSVLFC